MSAKVVKKVLAQLYGPAESSEDEETYVREGMRICDEHNEPLNFWSQKLGRYQCIRCLINETEVHFIDYSYKPQLEKYRSIQSFGLRALQENEPMEHVIKDWKDDIRDILSRIHTTFIEMIAEYTRKFYRSLLHIESSDKMKQFYNEDSRQRERLDYMREKYSSIKNIIDDID